MHTPFHQKFDRNSTYFIGCIHLQHKNICKATTVWPKGFRDFDSLDIMDNAIISSLNKKVPENATLFMLGDMIFGDKTRIESFRNRINCKNIHYIYGNHCDFLRKKNEYHKLFSSLSDYLEIFVGRKLVVMSHYPFLVWRENGHGSYMIHSHSHGNLKIKYGRILDVGWDVKNEPFSFDEVDEILSKIKPESLDHHNSETT